MWKKAAFKVAVVLLCVCALLALIVHRRALIVKRATQLLEATLSQGSEYQVRIGRIRASLNAGVTFENVEMLEPWLEPGQNTVLTVERLIVRYRILDLISKHFESGLEVDVIKPVVTWRPHLGLRRMRLPMLDWMRQWALAQRRSIKINVRDLTLRYGVQGRTFAGINASYGNDRFHMELPLQHLALGPSDVSTVLLADGRFKLGSNSEDDQLVGSIRTEGSVVDWKPVPEESTFEYVLTHEAIELVSSRVLGGIELAGGILFDRELGLDLLIRADKYPLANLSAFMKSAEPLGVPGRLDLEMHFYGSLMQPQVDSRARIYDGWTGGRPFKAMDVNVTGVYPTLRLEDSRILLEDGTTMQFAERALEARDLFNDTTYNRLVSEAQQDTVVWGDWEFSRPVDKANRPEFLAQRSMGDRTRLHFRKSNEDEQKFQESEARPMEFGVEYRLLSKDSLKFSMREDEEFLGVEHKTKF